MTVALERLAAEVSSCRRCPRLVAWREQVARERRAAYRDEDYWGRPVPGYGDPKARLLLLGLAPAAHGGNRTGRIFTGDRSGDFLFAGMWRTGLANQPSSTSRDDGLRLHGVWITAAVKCAPPANKPTGQERTNCLPWAEEELALLPGLQAVLCLGGFAWDAALRLFGRAEAAPSRAPVRRGAAVKSDSVRGAAPKPRFAHGASAEWGGMTLIGCYHPSQQNTFTGRLTPAMLDEVLLQAKQLAGLGAPA